MVSMFYKFINKNQSAATISISLKSEMATYVKIIIIANLGIKGDNPVKPLEKSDLKCSAEKGERDGDIMLRKINTFLTAKNVPEDKKNLIIESFSQGLLTNENINKPINGESPPTRASAWASSGC